MKNSIECIIFDCDGTLVDSEYLCNLGLEIKLRELGIKESASKMMLEYRGGKLARIIKSLEQKHQVILGDDFVIAYRKLVEELFKTDLHPTEGIIEALENINLPICVASSGPIDKIKQALIITNLKRFFNENIFSSYQIGSWKPEPEIFLYAAQKMGFAANECAVVEDSLVGIEAAISANMYPILYNSSNLSTSIRGISTIEHMSELCHVITSKGK